MLTHYLKSGPVKTWAFCLLTMTGFTSQSSLAQEVMTKDEVRIIIREYLLENPELMLEVQTGTGAKTAGRTGSYPAKDNRGKSGPSVQFALPDRFW